MFKSLPPRIDKTLPPGQWYSLHSPPTRLLRGRPRGPCPRPLLHSLCTLSQTSPNKGTGVTGNHLPSRRPNPKGNPEPPVTGPSAAFHTADHFLHETLPPDLNDTWLCLVPWYSQGSFQGCPLFTVYVSSCVTPKVLAITVTLYQDFQYAHHYWANLWSSSLWRISVIIYHNNLEVNAAKWTNCLLLMYYFLF